MTGLIDKRALWAHALASARAVYNPEDLTEPVHVYKNGTQWWFDVALDLSAVTPGNTIGVLLPGKGWVYAHPVTPTGCPREEHP